MYKKYFIISILGVFSWLNTVSAEAPPAYRGPASVDEIGLTTIIEYDVNKRLTYTFSFLDGYDYQRQKTVQGDAREKGRVTVRQYPIDARNNYPVELSTTGPGGFEVKPTFEVGELKGPSGFDTRPLYAGPWIHKFNISLEYKGDGKDPSSYLKYSYPETMNNGATQNYARSEGFTVGGSAMLSPDKGKSGIGVNASYTQTHTVGGGVSTQQMRVTRGNQGLAGNRWDYMTWIDNGGHIIDIPYKIWDNGGNQTTVLNAIPDIAKKFTPVVGQFWKIPKGVSQEFRLDIQPEYTFTYGVEHWSWGIYLGPYHGPKGSILLKDNIGGDIKLDTKHPAIAGLNAFRFRYGNTNKCWTEDYEHGWPTMKMQDCNSQIATQYFAQNGDFTMETLTAVSRGTTDWVMVKNMPLRLHRGNIQCATYNGWACLINTDVSALDRKRLIPSYCEGATVKGNVYRPWGDWCVNSLPVLEKAPRWSPSFIQKSSSGQPANTDWFEWNDRRRGSLTVRLSDGQVQCASYNEKNCLWGQGTNIDFAKIKPLTCGEGHRKVWGIDGYSNPNHWCAKALSRLKEIANAPMDEGWFKDEKIFPGAFLRIHEGNIGCYSLNGTSCSKFLPSRRVAAANLLVCGKDFKNKHGLTGYEDPSHWCSVASTEYLPLSANSESGNFYSKFYFTDDGTIKTFDGDYLVDVSGNTPIVRDVNTSGIRNGLWQYLVF